MPLLEYTPCPLCHLDRPLKKFRFEPFQVVQCTACQLWYLSPRLPESEMLKRYADVHYFKGDHSYGYAQASGSYFDQEQTKRLTFRKFLHQLKRRGLITGGHLLEVGCGYGFLLQEAASLFDTVTGIDFNNEAIAHVQQLGFTGFHGQISELATTLYYDCIIATDVIEHVYQPILFIQQVRQHLKPNGWIILATPKMNSFWFKLQGRNWSSFKIPEHVTYYSPQTLTELFHRCGARRTLTLSYLQAFSLNLIAEKLGFSLPNRFNQYYFWLPETLFTVAAQF